MGCDGGDIEAQALGLLQKLRAAAPVKSGFKDRDWILRFSSEPVIDRSCRLLHSHVNPALL
jgi:hypothetical protein